MHRYAKLLDTHTIELTDADGAVVTKRAKYVIIVIDFFVDLAQISLLVTRVWCMRGEGCNQHVFWIHDNSLFSKVQNLWIELVYSAGISCWQREVDRRMETCPGMSYALRRMICSG